MFVILLLDKLPYDDDYLEVTNRKVKASHTRYRALGPELIPVYN